MSTFFRTSIEGKFETQNSHRFRSAFDSRFQIETGDSSEVCLRLSFIVMSVSSNAEKNPTESQVTNDNKALIRTVYFRKEKISERENLQKSNSHRRLCVDSHYFHS